MIARRLGGLLLVALAVVVLAACRDNNGGASGSSETSPAAEDSATPPQAPTSVTSAARSEGCGAAEQPSAGDSNRTLQFGGLDRTYVLHIPPSYDGSTPVPLVLNFHGFGSSGRQQATYSRFPAKADDEGFIVVSPDGAGSPKQWNILRLNGLPDDIGFARALLGALERELCIDTGRVFAAGISNGSAFAQQLACAMPERMAAVAAVGALVYPPGCASDLPIAVIAFHGTEDACVPYEGGQVACGARRGQVAPVEDAALSWARHDGCNLDPARTALSKHVSTIAYSECDGETAVVLFVVEGGGHTWPGSVAVARLGNTTDEVDATEQIWQFFEAQANQR